jgi:hypothetical protein
VELAGRLFQNAYCGAPRKSLIPGHRATRISGSRSELLRRGFGQEHRFDRWEAWYFFVTAPMSLLGVILGAIGKETPRIPGLVLSACILLRVLGAAVSMLLQLRWFLNPEVS